MSEFCLVVDASCDIPASYNAHPRLRILPTMIEVAGKKIPDARDPAVTLDFYSKYLHDSNSTTGKSEALSVEQMITSLTRTIATTFDEALGVFVSSKRSPIYYRAKQAAGRARLETLAPRLHAGKHGPIVADCVDSTNLFAGYGAQVLDLLDLVDQGAMLAQILVRQTQTAPQTYTYMVPGNVDFILKRAALKGEKSVSALAGFAAKTLLITPIICGHRNETAPVGRKFGQAKARDAMLARIERLVTEKKLLSPHIAVSFSGPLQEVKALPGFEKLQKTAHAAGVQLHLAQMSMTGAINVGPQSLSVGVVAQQHSFD